MELKVLEELNTSSAVSSEIGDKLYEKLCNIVKNNEKTKDLIIVDFNGIDDLTTAFLNNSIGKLFLNYNTKYLMDTLRFSGLKNSNHINLLKLTIFNAIENSQS
ncbi:STAS-like domain-containing protein [Clostridium perfringens]|uniref:STAS-like domain-containing protein n=1 Tax=Clostridium perfringens TaxID=1502 RepID=UPI000D719753|nr:STAS-like domain-containing protein [Clostridium perfringens]EGT0691117.1 STAS-like domain-containing protein [Clostridium perfringens]EGT4142287.1 DUF4325 domain-containing protein [Clostridium perfringens]EJT6167373.1 STAS-like domain-containing protein [Clostridium perfringens]EJT6620723.1 STAS-like domain-containing protein [Clostridium perfringens]ELC8409600.1 STAS-like domain-containing protein [Clostridium perfringens]